MRRVNGPIDLVLHDWENMPAEERKQALEDVRSLAEVHTGLGKQRRGRALNVMASFFYFLTEEPKEAAQVETDSQPPPNERP